ncbi:acidic ribosomal protein P40 [Zea mays]|uniref:Acidic ribosomal protein P40 n=1 Tax=Zea mays TaxID=4577 RepID=A0A1D6PJJ2_MAIZE|nr:acidic ribosomal protein P40 [Zea mays]
MAGIKLGPLHLWWTALYLLWLLLLVGTKQPRHRLPKAGSRRCPL